MNHDTIPDNPLKWLKWLRGHPPASKRNLDKLLKVTTACLGDKLTIPGAIGLLGMRAASADGAYKLVSEIELAVGCDLSVSVLKRLVDLGLLNSGVAGDNRLRFCLTGPGAKRAMAIERDLGRLVEKAVSPFAAACG